MTAKFSQVGDCEVPVRTPVTVFSQLLLREDVVREETLQADPRLCEDWTVRWLQERVDGSAFEVPCITLEGLRECRNLCPNHRGRKHLPILKPARSCKRMLLDGAICTDLDKCVVSGAEPDLESLHARPEQTSVVLASHQLIIRLRHYGTDGVLAVTDLTCLDLLRELSTLGLLIFEAWHALLFRIVIRDDLVVMPVCKLLDDFRGHGKAD